jgi:sugar-specific transcriptional regulator TrmB
MEESRVINVLKSIGLNRNEIFVYLDLIKKGKSSALEISKRTQLHRSNVYDILEKLFEKGIIDETIEDSKKYFYPIEPEDLLDYLKQKEIELESILPEIEKIHNLPKEDRYVAISRGINSVKNIIQHLLDLNSPIQIYGMVRKMQESMGIFMEQFHRKRIKRKIASRIIYSPFTEDEAKKMNSLDYTRTGILATSRPKVTVFICFDKVVIVIWEIPVEAIIIQGKEIKETFEEYFNFLWESAKTPNM